MAGRAQLTNLRRISAADADLVAGFLESIPEGDRTFFKESVDRDTVERWCRDETTPRWLLVGDDGEPQAYLAIIPGVGWSAHVGELRLVVGALYRRRGLGSALARRGLVEGLRLGLTKLTVEVVADKQGDIEMFTSMGFQAEALLKDHIRDLGGDLHDLVILAHDVREIADDMSVVGIDEAVGLGDGA